MRSFKFFTVAVVFSVAAVSCASTDSARAVSPNAVIAIQAPDASPRTVFVQIAELRGRRVKILDGPALQEVSAGSPYVWPMAQVGRKYRIIISDTGAKVIVDETIPAGVGGVVINLPPAPVDPRDAQIATLQSQLAEASRLNALLQSDLARIGGTSYVDPYGSYRTTLDVVSEVLGQTTDRPRAINDELLVLDCFAGSTGDAIVQRFILNLQGSPIGGNPVPVVIRDADTNSVLATSSDAFNVGSTGGGQILSFNLNHIVPHGVHFRIKVAIDSSGLTDSVGSDQLGVPMSQATILWSDGSTGNIPLKMSPQTVAVNYK